MKRNEQNPFVRVGLGLIVHLIALVLAGIGIFITGIFFLRVIRYLGQG